MKQRILAVGCPGSGKTTFALRLAVKTGLPLFHLDSICWRADHTHLTREELVEVFRPILASPRWIIDGNCNGTMALRRCAWRGCVRGWASPGPTCPGWRRRRIRVTPRKAARRCWH